MKKGFTLVELLATLAILSLLLIVGTSSMAKIIKDNKQKLYNEQIKSFEEAAKNWSYKNTDLLPVEGNSLKLTLAILKNTKYINEAVKNPLTGEYFTDNNYVCIFNTNGIYTYTYNGAC